MSLLSSVSLGFEIQDFERVNLKCFYLWIRVRKKMRELSSKPNSNIIVKPLKIPILTPIFYFVPGPPIERTSQPHGGK